METLVIRLVIGALALVSAWHVGSMLWADMVVGESLRIVRGVAAVGFGWIGGWYFTTRWQPTQSFLAEVVFALAGWVVMALTATVVVVCVGLLDLTGLLATGSADFVGIALVTFVPVAAYFATHVAEDRSVHFVSGIGLGLLGYVTLVGIPS